MKTYVITLPQVFPAKQALWKRPSIWNEQVKVTLTDKGAQIITEYYADMHNDYPLIPAKKFKEGDVLEEQLYYLMKKYVCRSRKRLRRQQNNTDH